MSVELPSGVGDTKNQAATLWPNGKVPFMVSSSVVDRSNINNQHQLLIVLMLPVSQNKIRSVPYSKVPSG